MRVALFFDGKNFYSDLRTAYGRQSLDFVALAEWVMRRVGGTFLWGANYYTGVDAPGSIDTGDASSLNRFLDMLEHQPGYFVNRFVRKQRVYTCPHCQGESTYSLEKEVDAAMVADMVRLAAVNAYDVMVLLSGDADYAPALDSVRMLGKQAYVATWGLQSLSRRIRRAAFNHIDLAEFLQEQGPHTGAHEEDPITAATEPARTTTSYISGTIARLPSADTAFAPETLDEFVREVARAEAHFAEGYVGLNYFLTRWQSPSLDRWPDTRRRILDQAVAEMRVDVYDAHDGKKAIRVHPSATVPPL